MSNEAKVGQKTRLRLGRSGLISSLRVPADPAEWRKSMRPIDALVYEPVIVGCLEDALCAALLNPDLGTVTSNLNRGMK